MSDLIWIQTICKGYQPTTGFCCHLLTFFFKINFSVSNISLVACTPRLQQTAFFFYPLFEKVSRRQQNMKNYLAYKKLKVFSLSCHTQCIILKCRNIFLTKYRLLQKIGDFLDSTAFWLQLLISPLFLYTGINPLIFACRVIFHAFVVVC